MSHTIAITMGDMKIGSSPDVLETVGVGSCLVTIIYDPVLMIGGMAHSILPLQTAAGDDNPLMRFRYVHESINAMIDGILKAGAKHDRLIAKLIGGAHMFAILGDAVHGIGVQNVEEGRRTLEQQGIPILAEETGGNVGRTIRFDLASGVCSVETHL